MRCAHTVVANSHSLIHEIETHQLINTAKVQVLGAGGSNGVNTDRFRPVIDSDNVTLSSLKHKLAISDNALIVGYVGRLTQDKGIADLVYAFQQVRDSLPNTFLLLVGKFEAGDPLPDDVVAQINNNNNIITTDFVSDTSIYYRVMDVFAFTSYREGLPNAPLEAAASDVPTVGYAATGTVDVVKHGETGLLTTSWKLSSIKYRFG